MNHESAFARLTRTAEPWKPRVLYETRRSPRRSGYVTQAMIDQHGSFRAAFDVLTSQGTNHE